MMNDGVHGVHLPRVCFHIEGKKTHSWKVGFHVWHPSRPVPQLLTTGFAMYLAIKSWKKMVSVKCRSARFMEKWTAIWLHRSDHLRGNLSIYIYRIEIFPAESNVRSPPITTRYCHDSSTWTRQMHSFPTRDCLNTVTSGLPWFPQEITPLRKGIKICHLHQTRRTALPYGRYVNI